MNLKTKTKRKTAILSIAFMCLFVLSFGLTVKAADAPTMSVVHVDSYTSANYPINVYVNFEWDTGLNRQVLLSVHLYYSINKVTIGETNYVLYEWEIFGDPQRPLTVVMVIPSAALVPGDVIRFKVDALGMFYNGDEFSLSSEKYTIRIQEVGWEEQGNLIMIIGISAGVALFVCIVLLIYAFRRRRN